MLGRAAGSFSWKRWRRWFRGLGWKLWCGRTMPRQARDGNLWGCRSCCGRTSCNSGSTCPTPAWRRPCTSLRRCGGLWGGTLALLRRRTRRRCCADPNHKAIDAYGVPLHSFGTMHYAEHMTFLVAPDGTIAKEWNVKDIESPSAEILATIHALNN